MPTSAIPTGEVTDEGIAAVIGIWVEYGADTNYGSEVQRYNLNELTLPGNFDVPITGLTCDATYHYRFKVRNNGMLDGYSTDDTFTTSECYPEDIVSHWTLNEGSGTRVDSIGDNDLAPVNSPSTLTGHINDAVEATTAGSKYLSVADNASLSTGNDTNFVVSLWVKLNAKTGTQVFVSKFDNVSTGEYAVYYEHSNGDGRFMFSTYTGGTSYPVSADTLGSPDTGTWYYITATHNAENNTNSIQVDSLAADTVSGVVEHQDSTAPFLIGAFGSVPVYLADAVIDDVRFSKSVYVDTTAPTIQSVSPADDETNVSIDTNITITFDEAVVKGTGLITIAAGNNDLLVENITVTSDQVTGEGTTTITIDPTYDFASGETIYINIPDTAFKDTSDNYAQGLNGGHSNVPSFTIEYDPYIITVIKPIPAKVSGSTATYTFSVSGEGEAEYIAEMCGGDADGYFTSMSDDPEHQSVTLFNLEPGITYECEFGIQSLSGYSNFLHIGPFRVVNSISGYATPETLAKSGITLAPNLETKHVCSADQTLTFPVTIKLLQTRLLALGFNPGPIDGISGPMTINAIKQAQTFFKIDIDGLVGPVTREKINNSCTK